MIHVARGHTRELSGVRGYVKTRDTGRVNPPWISKVEPVTKKAFSNAREVSQKKPLFPFTNRSLQAR